MKYLCLAYYDEKKFETLTPADMAAIEKECRPLDADLQRTGRLLEVGSLAATKDSVSLRPRGGKVSVTDGPYAETKEHLAGFWIINAADLDAALEWAKLATVAEQRPIEVRPLFDGDLDDAIRLNSASDTQ